jgi:autotransporter translocation and assembly factor TamB
MRMKRLVVAFLILLLGVALGAWLTWPTLTNVARERAERIVSEALGVPGRIGRLSISVFPLRARLSGVVIGTAPTNMAEAGIIDVRLWALASLTELRPVVSVQVESVNLDLRQLPQPKVEPPGPNHHGGGFPSLRVEQFQLERARVSFQLGEAATTLTVAQATATSESRTHSVKATLHVGGVKLKRKDHELKLQEIRVVGGADRRGLFIETASVTGEGIEVSLSPAVAAHEHTLAAAIDLGQVSGFLGESVQGDLRVDGTLTGNLTNPDSKARVTIANLAIKQWAMGALKAQVTRQAQTVRVVDLDVSGPLGNATGTGSVVMSGSMPIEGTLRLQDVDLDAVLRALGQSEEVGHEVTGTASISGTLRPRDVIVKAGGAIRQGLPTTATAPASDPEPADQTEAGTINSHNPTQKTKSGQEIATFGVNGHIEQGGATVEIELQQQQQNNRLTASLSSKNKQLVGPVHLQMHDLGALSRLMPESVRELGLTGQVEGSATLSGTVAQPKIQASITGREISIAGVTVPQVAGDVVIQNSVLSTRSFKILTATGSTDFSGALALGHTAENDWRLEISRLDTDLVVGIIHALARSAVPVSGGKLNGTVQARGPWGRVALDATVSASSVYLEREPFERVDLKVKTELPRWTLHASVVHTATEELTIDGSGTGTAGLQLAINSTPFQLANFRGAGRRNLTGTVVVHGAIAGSLKQPGGTLDLAASNVGVEGQLWGDATLRASGRQGEWTATMAAFENTLRSTATLRLTSGFPYTVNAQLRGFQLGHVISSDESLQAAISGDVELNGSVKALARPSGTVDITQLDISRGQYRVSAAEPIRIDASDGRFSVRSMVLAAPSSRLSVSGELTTSGNVDLTARGEGNLVSLELIGQPVSSARGEFTVAVRIRRRPESGWDLSGQGQVRDTTLDLGLPVAFTNVNGDFILSGSSVRIEHLDGKAGGGQFHVAGSVSLNDGPDITWKLQEVSVTGRQGLEAEVSGAGRVRGTWKTVAVSGDVEIISALYDQNIEITDFLPFLREQIRPTPRTKPPATQVHLSLHIHAPGGLYIDNNVAKVELSADLRVDGTVDNPQVTGTIEFLTGEVTFRQRTFNITGGSINFQNHGRINPILNISSESQISTAEADYTVTVTVTGTADNPHVELSADDPTLSETDILSLITFGQTTAQLQSQGGGISPIDAVALLPTGTITAPIAKLIGVNRLEIEAVHSPVAGGGSAGSIQPRVTIGKDLTDRFRASVSTAFGVSTEQTAQLEYRLTRRISLLGSWEGQTTGQAGAFGGDVKFRYEFRRLPFLLLPGGLQTTAGDDVH